MLDSTNPKAFNFSLKKAVQEATGLKVGVEIINSNKFPHCWVRVIDKSIPDIPNDFRLKVFDACGNDRKSLLNVNDVSYGNIQSNMISAYVKDWIKLFN